ncbi:hypothetical protein BJ742DRAFT_801886 [Cladochytrium replicatum]|nr:hypothetical protein BJ742DRAFT_801886 [Cladochytrium replicatum]
MPSQSNAQTSAIQQYPRKWLENTVTYSTACTFTGASLGAMIASWSGKQKLPYAFSMGSNWLAVCGPFIALREAGIVGLRTTRVLLGERDEMAASFFAGSVVGGGWTHYRLNRPFMGGATFYGGLSRILQPCLTSSRETPNISKRITTLFNKPAFSLNEDFSPRDPFQDFDPIEWAIAQLRISLPAWASPFANAFDVEYRKRLSMRILILEDDIEGTRQNIEKLGGDPVPQIA